MPHQLDGLPLRDLQKLEAYAVESIRAMNPDAALPDTPEQIREKRARLADKDAVIKSRGYALTDEK